MTLPIDNFAVGSSQPDEGAPFKPRQIFLMGFLFSPFGAAIMAGLNWKRLGYPLRLWNPILQLIVFFSVISIIKIILSLHKTSGQFFPSDLVLYSLSSLAFTVWLTWRHRHSRDDWLAAHDKSSNEGDGWLTILKIMVAAAVLWVWWLNFVAPYFIAPASLTILNTFVPSRSFAGDEVAFAYPGKWLEFPIKEDPFCKQDGVECIFGAVTLYSIDPPLGSQFQVDRLRNTGLVALLSGPLDAEKFATTAKEQISEQEPNVRWKKEQALQIDEHDAYELVFEMDGERRVMFFIEDGRAILRLVAFGSISHIESLQSELEGIAQGIRFSRSPSETDPAEMR